jgi:hypothetical protein
MTDRKPPNVSIPDWVEHQIREAERRGDFDNLPGKGKPLASLNEPHDDMSWVAAKLRRENVPISAILPAALALAKEVEDLPLRLAREKSETSVRAMIEDLNNRILQAHRRPQDGPPVRVSIQDVENLVEAWRRQRAG